MRWSVSMRPGYTRDYHDRRNRRNAEETAAAYVKAHAKKPVVGFGGGADGAAGTPHGTRGAIIAARSGKAEDKIAAMADAGITICSTPAELERK